MRVAHVSAVEGRHMNEGATLRQVAERIAQTPYGEGRFDEPGTTTRLASILQAGGRQEIGTMTLTENQLAVWNNRLFALQSATTGGAGGLTLTGSSLPPSVCEFGSQPKCVVTLVAD